MEFLWLRIHRQDEILQLKLVAAKFAIGIVLEKKENVSWALFAEVTNDNENSKYRETIQQLKLEKRKRLLEMGVQLCVDDLEYEGGVLGDGQRRIPQNRAKQFPCRRSY